MILRGFFEIPDEAAQKKNVDLFIFSLLTDMYCKKMSLQKYEMIVINSIGIVIF